jgi:signal transduction histidine kinase/CheY-like chemotaxis protein
VNPGSEARAPEDLHAEIDRLKRINAALIERVERNLDQQGNAFSLFQTAIKLESEVKRRTQELTNTLADLESSNRELKSARDGAEAASLSKTRFLAAASHDVLQPLNAALLSVSSLSCLLRCDESARLCTQIERSLETMDSLLRTLLYMSRLDSGDITPKLSAVSLYHLFDSLASDFQPIAKQRGLELRVVAPDLYVVSDETLLRRILQNILANALRYTDSGGVILIAGAPLGAGQVHVRVADTGIGIAPDQLSEVFVEFSRGRQPSAPSNRVGAGLGLGLAIVDRLVTALGHRIELRSRLEHGSCFRLSMPQAKSTPDVPSKSTDIVSVPRSLNNVKLLVIENDPDVLIAMESLLQQWGCELRLAHSTDDAMAVIVDTDWRPDLIIADHHLNGDDRGTAAIAQVRAHLNQELPALLVTAAPSPEVYNRAQSGGMEIMEKPLKPAQLRALLSHLAGTTNGASPETTGRS